MAGIALAVHVPAMMAAAVAVETAKLVQLKTVLVMVIAVQSLGLVMVLQIVKIRLMAVISPAMIMTAATAKAGAAAVKTAMTVNLIGRPMDLNVAIPHGMSMALIAPH